MNFCIPVEILTMKHAINWSFWNCTAKVSFIFQFFVSTELLNQKSFIFLKKRSIIDLDGSDKIVATQGDGPIQATSTIEAVPNFAKQPFEHVNRDSKNTTRSNGHTTRTFNEIPRRTSNAKCTAVAIAAECARASTWIFRPNSRGPNYVLIARKSKYWNYALLAFQGIQLIWHKFLFEYIRLRVSSSALKCRLFLHEDCEIQFAMASWNTTNLYRAICAKRGPKGSRDYFNCVNKVCFELYHWQIFHRG